MVAPEPKHQDPEYQGETSYHNGNNLFTGQSSAFLKVRVRDMDQADKNDENYYHGKKRDKRDEVLVIAFTNTGPNPRAVVVESFNTAVAETAVDRTGRAVDVARIAVFNFGHLAIHHVQILELLLIRRLINFSFERFKQESPTGNTRGVLHSCQHHRDACG